MLACIQLLRPAVLSLQLKLCQSVIYVYKHKHQLTLM